MPAVKCMPEGNTRLEHSGVVWMLENVNNLLMTWATTNTMGGLLIGNVVDHVPVADTAASDDVENGHHQRSEGGSFCDYVHDLGHVWWWS